jgi:hypothetical protein
LFDVSEAIKISPKFRSAVTWLPLIVGLVIWTGSQGYLTSIPLWTRSLPPEVDDSLAYLVRAHEIEGCLFQDCPALQDLRQQVCTSSLNPDAARQRQIAGFPFPFYHPGFSLVLLGIKKLGVDLTTAYKVLWGISPLLFGAAFACLLTTLWDKQAAGVAMGLLAFKLFPDTGLHYLTPSNFAMAIALFVWARIMYRRGDAPWTLIFGSIALFTIHPIGGLYAVMAALLTLLMPGTNRKRAWIAASSVALIALLVTIIVSTVKKPSVVNVFSDLFTFPGLTTTLKTCLTNILGAFVEIVRLKDGLFGSLGLFLFSVAFGFLSASRLSRTLVIRLLAVNGLFVLGSLILTSAVSPPADLFFRLWIPAVVILFGAVGSGICYALREGLATAGEWRSNPRSGEGFNTQRLWPVLVLALLLGYSLDAALCGAEQIQATVEYMTERQPLNFDPRQASLLMSLSQPGDRVLYTSTMAMSFYFLHGAMSLGAVYYHPAFENDQSTANWLHRPDLRFMVAYNPTVYHPSLSGLDEKDQCITYPEYRHSPLSHPRTHGPINREGYIHASDFKWIQFDMQEGHALKAISIFVRNPGKALDLKLIPIDRGGSPIQDLGVAATVPADWTGKIRFDAGDTVLTGRYKLLLPVQSSQMLIYGMNFDESTLQWPWKQKSLVTFSAKDPETGRFTVSFDPADLLPAQLKDHKISVLDDRGSSVLLLIDK